MSKVDLSNYVEVNERIAAFAKKHPEGSLQGRYEIQQLGDQTRIVFIAKAYRTPDDKRPGMGHASEPFPGKTTFTKDSELMNAETSAWGRALAALGFEVQRSVASKEEVQNRSGNGKAKSNGGATSNQKRAITTVLNKAGVNRDFQKTIVHAVGGDPLTKAGASKILDVLNREDFTPQQNRDKLIELAGVDWPSGLPEPDTSDFDEAPRPERPEDSDPFTYEGDKGA